CVQAQLAEVERRIIVTCPLRRSSMHTMTVMPYETHTWTIDDLAALPDDGQRYEIIDGVLFVSPAPIPLHQRAIRKLLIVLESACPPELEVFLSPLDYQPHQRTSVQPDLLVVRNGDMNPKNLTIAPLLAVEVLSPSSKRRDLVLKHSVYADCGVASYWVVDPEAASIRAWNLADGGYTEAGDTSGERPITLDQPYPVTVVPAQLLCR
ncbi:MAG: Uma2 family endonuclease, partial [Mycobacteriales bacterium]